MKHYLYRDSSFNSSISSEKMYIFQGKLIKLNHYYLYVPCSFSSLMCFKHKFILLLFFLSPKKLFVELIQLQTIDMKYFFVFN